MLWLLFISALAGQPDPRDQARAACDAGDAAQCTRLARMFHSGEGAPKDPAYAMDLYRKGCEGGDSAGCLGRANAYRNGDGVIRNASRAFSIYEEQCEEHDVGSACRILGEMYVLGDGVIRDAAKSNAWYSRGCMSGDGEACVGAALGVERGDVGEPDPETARQLFNSACSLGEARGCTKLAERLLYGREGLSKDVPRAAILYQMGCGASDALACRELGRLAVKGKGLQKDRVLARMSFDMSCTQGDYEACLDLSDMLKKKDLDGALDAAHRGCQLNYADACDRAEFLMWKQSMRRKKR